jgi:hypothetical protein
LRRAHLGLVLIAAVAASSCGPSAITAERIERAIEPTFANLVAVQVSRLQMPATTPPEFDVTASCRRPGATSDAGAGEWICRLRWLGPDRQTLRDTFDLTVTTDGCYTATAEGEQLGGPTLTARDGTAVRNLLRVFEGCFDTM